MYKKEEIELRVADYLAGLMDQDQEKEFTDWVKSSAKNAELFADLCARWEIIASTHSNQRFNIEKGWRKLAFRVDPALRFKLLFREYGRIAAIFILAFLLGVAAYQFNPGNWFQYDQTAWIINETPMGNKTIVTLPDGSRVWSNAGSIIRYPSDFNREDRVVYLEGEAFFQISTNPKRPFDVYASGVKVTATGTSFNIRAYKEENFVETTLVEGVVTINKADAPKHEAIELKPSQKFTVFTESTLANTEKENPTDYNPQKENPIPSVTGSKLVTFVETEIYTSWKDEEWIISREPFSSLATKLERRYDVSIAINDNRIGKLTYSGKLKDETLEQVMNVICQTSPISYRLDGKNVTVWYNEDFNKK